MNHSTISFKEPALSEMKAKDRKTQTFTFILIALIIIYGSSFFPISAFLKQGVCTFSGTPWKGFRESCTLEPSCCLPPYAPKQPVWLVSQQHKLAVCKIEKVMSTFMTATVCYLNRTEQFLNAGRQIHTELWADRFCNASIEYETLPVTKRDKWTFMVVARDPITRFMSGWMDKCITMHDDDKHICYNCNKNMTCFLEELLRRANGFAEFPRREEDFEMHHFLPQNWYCPLENVDFKVVQYGDTDVEKVVMKKTFERILKTSKVTQKQIDYITAEFNIESPHATTYEPGLRSQYLRELLETPALWRRFMELYYHDFTLFDFKVPVVN